MIAAGKPARAYQPCRLKSELSCAKLQKLTKYACCVELYSTSTTRSESVFRLGGGVGVRLIPGVGGVDVLPCPCPIRKRVCISGYIVRQQRAPPPFTYLPDQKKGLHKWLYSTPTTRSASVLRSCPIQKKYAKSEKVG